MMVWVTHKCNSKFLHTTLRVQEPVDHQACHQVEVWVACHLEDHQVCHLPVECHPVEISEI